MARHRALSRGVTRALDRFFKLSEHRTNVRTEITAGFTTFAALAYILAVNPGILSAAGMDFGAVVTATALASAIMTAVFALATNWPIALAPGMGLNAFFAFTICVGLQIPWQAALAMVFFSGLCFLALSLTGLRQRIIEAIPHELKIAISCGIGLFIAFIGLQKGGIIAAHPVTLVTAGKLGSPRVLLVLAGIVLTAVLHHRGAGAHRCGAVHPRIRRQRAHENARAFYRHAGFARADLHGFRFRLCLRPLAAVPAPDLRVPLRRSLRQHGHAHRRLFAPRFAR
jgi:xanthine/uracil/vitamin C permease (AzgA family)